MKLSALALGAMLSVSALVGVAYAANPDVGGAPMYEDKNIIENAVNSADHTTLVAAVQAAGLVETLSGPGPFTVLAPTNEAFAALPAGTVENLLKPENKDKLVAILTAHVVPAKVMAGDIADGTAEVDTLNPDVKLKVTKDANGVTVALSNSAKVVSADVAADNGVIHVIDAVLLP